MLRNVFYTLKRMRSANLDNRMGNDGSSFQEDIEMSNRIKRRVTINGVTRWISASTEQEYAENLMKLAGAQPTNMAAAPRHNFRAYAKNWFTIYSNPNIERATAETYQRQLACHIYPRLGEMDIEDVTTDHIQALFNGMNAAKASKDKTRMVLNMIFETALDEGIIAKNPMKSRRLRITGRASEPTEEYSIEQMRYLVQHIPSVADETDRAYLALQALHPLRLEEVGGRRPRTYAAAYLPGCYPSDAKYAGGQNAENEGVHSNNRAVPYRAGVSRRGKAGRIRNRRGEAVQLYAGSQNVRTNSPRYRLPGSDHPYPLPHHRADGHLRSDQRHQAGASRRRPHHCCHDAQVLRQRPQRNT